MSNQLAKLDNVLIQGDLSSLSPEQKLNYYSRVCESLGLNPLTKPFAYIKLNNKEVLYATRDCTDQLRANNKISMSIVSREVIEGIYVVTAKGKTLDGREDEATGAVNIDKLTGEMKANAFMKAETKAKRRLTLSICGLGFTDESEIESIPGAKFADIPTPQTKKMEFIPPLNKNDEGYLGMNSEKSLEDAMLEAQSEIIEGNTNTDWDQPVEDKIELPEIGTEATKSDTELYFKSKKDFASKYPGLELCKSSTGKYVFQPFGTYAATKKAS